LTAHSEFLAALEKYGLAFPAEQLSLLESFALAVHKENAMYNLTGRRTVADITDDLVCRSIAPLKGLNVPRGISAADMGSGAGVPGIPLAAVFPEINWTLFDSSAKKTAFINSFAKRAGLVNVSAENGRVEQLADAFRGAFDMVVSRAMAGVYICAELGAPLLKTGGFMYLYSNQTGGGLSANIISHCEACGLALNEGARGQLGIAEEGILFIKTGEGRPLPRHFSVIKREAARCENAGEDYVYADICLHLRTGRAAAGDSYVRSIGRADSSGRKNRPDAQAVP
jgi:16S rRNA (guanine527-N7)-methyltransferase